jgi:excisionase family DNA binding protein
MTVQEASEYLGVSTKTIKRRAKRAYGQKNMSL